VIIDRESILKYWLSEPVRGYIADGWVELSHIPFPDLSECSPAERAALRRIVEKHPEYLHEILCDRRLQ
jgi:hypothetical protein